MCFCIVDGVISFFTDFSSIVLFNSFNIILAILQIRVKSYNMKTNMIARIFHVLCDKI